MRKAQKQKILDFIHSLHQAHEEIKEAIRLQQQNNDLPYNMQNTLKMLSECQGFAISLGESIEKTEGEGHITVSYIEEYCEILFYIYKEMGAADGDFKRESSINGNKIYKSLRKQLIKIENSVKEDIAVRKEIVFFSYKASMWDSMESVYLAAKEDANSDAYCVAIPYYDLKPDRSFGQMHYEGHDYPQDITVIDWEKYNFEERKPDVIYTNYAYDNWNLVTSIHPRYYSANLKKYTDCLVYCPYYSTAGGMSEGQRTLPVYFNADYIVIQAPMFRDYFDERIPDNKFLPFGSPKFDRIIKKCQNPPNPPVEWKEKMMGQDGKHKKVFFYNTSINGMLGDTDAFLKKMRYVFDTFKDRKDVCILWRPHPLLESTFNSMRLQHRSAYEELKRYYIENDIGIFDDTPDMTDAIAWSDAYIGDAATSVTSVFGIVGKPLFILNNQLWSLPEEESWRGAIVGNGLGYLPTKWYSITQGNKLYVSELYKHDYKYFCDLSEYAGGEYYLGVCDVNGKSFVCPYNAQDILAFDEKGVRRKISLEKRNGNNRESFYSFLAYEKYLFLIPLRYPALVRYNTENGEIKYFEENIDVFVKNNERNEKVAGGICIYEGMIYISSPTDSYIYKHDIESGKSEVLELPVNNQNGCIAILVWEDSLWMTPYRGQTILNWNPKAGVLKEYTGFPESFSCIHPSFKIVTDEYPVLPVAFFKNELYFLPIWGNSGLKLNMETGIFTRWDLPIPYKESTEYFHTGFKYSLFGVMEEGNTRYELFYWPERKMYSYDFEKNECGEEIEVKFDVDDLKIHEGGFCDYSQWLRYCCVENAFNSLKNFLDGNITGKQFDRDKQIRSYGKISANNDGSCGIKVHEFISSL